MRTSFSRIRSLSRFAARLALLVWASPAQGHGPFHEQISRRDAAIEEDPSRAALYVERGETYRAHGDIDAALADFTRAP